MPASRARLLSTEVARMSPRRLAARAIATLSAAIALVAVGWASSAVFGPAPDRAPTSVFTYATVIEGTIQDSVRIRVSATWQSEPVGANQLAGTVTSIDTGSDTVTAAGSILYRVDQRPVFVAQGAVPAYRPLARGDRGDDVRQLQGMLSELGQYTSATDGRFGSATERAVRTWQASNGMPTTGAIERGEIVFVPELPARLEVDATVIRRGAELVGGEVSVSALSSQPEFSATLTPAQSIVVTGGTPVSISAGPEQHWNAEIGEPLPQTDGTFAVALRGVDGAPICEDCGAIPAGRGKQFEADAVTTPAKHGLILPLGAVHTRADGRTVITDDSGGNRSIEIVASAQGRALITGVPEGTRARLQPAAAR